VKFARHLAAVMLVVAVIVAAGVALAHGAWGGSVAGGHEITRGLEAAHGKTPPGSGRVILVRPPAALNFSRTNDLIRTVIIEAALMAVVITLDLLRRRTRRSQRHPKHQRHQSHQDQPEMS
jgi:hypothetical protein